MQTHFTLAQLADPQTARSNEVLRTCVHCGFCLATCPTYVLLGDELDSPRGRIYLMKEMFEKEEKPTAETVKHIDRCLSCLACMTTCPSAVHYMHLVDHGRAYIEKTYRRPWPDRLFRDLLNAVLPYPRMFRTALIGAWFGRPFARLFPGRMGAMLALAPPRGPASPSKVDAPQVHKAQGERRLRVALLTGCAQRVLAPEINEATVRLLTRLGAEVVVAPDSGCCGALTHHMGKEEGARSFAIANIGAWLEAHERDPLDAVVINASGCGTMVKDYGHMLRSDPEWAAKAATISGITRDITEVLAMLGPLPKRHEPSLTIAYHSACSMQHGQKIRSLPKQLLEDAGFTVKDVPEGHLCCGSAGVYNIMQPEIADRLKERKVRNIEKTRPDIVATGNIGCITQIASASDLPVCHTVELLDWVSGGPAPKVLAGSLPKAA